MSTIFLDRRPCLASILSGYATPTRGAALGALGAMLLACRAACCRDGRRWPPLGRDRGSPLVALDMTGVQIWRVSQTTGR